MLSNSGKFRDRNAESVPAGKLFNLGDTAKECIITPKMPRTPEVVHKFRCTTQSSPGQERIFYGRYNDPNVASLLSHGINSKPCYVAGRLINPEPKSYFKYRLTQKREESVYASRKRAPLGRCHDQRPGLPIGVGPADQVYGVPTIKDCSAGELVSPAKTRKQVIEEGLQGLDLYKKSHNAYLAGESYNRQYNWSRVLPNSYFGKETPHDNRGLNTKETLKWMHETLSKKAAQITARRVDSFRERNMPQVGKVHDPIKETMRVSDDHVFGIMVKPDAYGAGDLIHMRDQKNFLKDAERASGVLAAIRQHLKNENYHCFNDIKSAFSYYDKDKSGKIDISELREVCEQFNLPVQRELLETLLAYCDQNEDNQIDYMKFSNFLNWRDKMTNSSFELKIKNDIKERPEKDEHKILKSSRDLNSAMEDDNKTVISCKQIDKSENDYKTSSSLVNGNIQNDYTKGLRPYGIPTIRSDLPAPRIRRIGDNTNYGDESDAYGLMNPSIYSNYGVYEEDFFKSRDQTEIQKIFNNIGVQMTNETFQEIWNQARQSSTNGQVSIETFRNILDEKVTEEFEQVNDDYDPENLHEMLEQMTIRKPELYSKFHVENSTNQKELVAC